MNLKNIRKNNSEWLGTALGITMLALVLLAGSAGAEPYAYIANANDNTVSVIDTRTNAVTTTVNVGERPFGVAVNPAGTKVYVANNGDGTVSVIDTETYAVINVSVGSSPYGVAISPDGSKVYVADTGVSVIDTTTYAVTKTVENLSPRVIVANPKGTKVYGASGFCGSRTSLSVIDAETYSVIDVTLIKRQSFGCWEMSSPYGIAINPAGTKVYVADWYIDAVFVIDTETYLVTKVNVGGNPRGVAVNPAGTKVYVANVENDNVSVIDASTNTVIDSLNVGKEPWGVAVNPAGTKVYVTNWGDNSVSVIDIETKAVARIIVGNYPFSVGQFIGPEIIQRPELKISATPTTVTVGTAIPVTFSVTGGDAPVSNTSITLSGNATGSGTTDSSGNAVISVNAATAGTITATASKTGYKDGNVTMTANPPTLSVTATPTTMTVGTETSVTFSVTGGGAAVSDASVTLSGSATGSGTTDSSGNAVISVNAATAGTITATASKTGYKDGNVTMTANPPTLSVTATPTSVTVGTATSVTFTVTSDNAPVSDVSITLSGSATGSGTTDSSGNAVISVNAATAGTITATASKTGYKDGTVTVTANAPTTPTPTPTPTPTSMPTPTPTPIGQNTFKVTLTSEPASVEPGKTSTITVTVTGSDDTGISGADVVLDSISDGKFDPPLGKTNPFGRFTSTFTAPDKGNEQGNATLEAIIKKEGFADGKQNLTLAMLPPPIVPPEFKLYSILVLIAILTVVLLYLWMKGDLKLVPRENGISCDGKSTLPVKVQFLNAFGKPRTQRKDRKIEMETSSGTIQSVVIPAGKKFTEAMLTSSTECGPVIITATSGKQKRTAQVNFMANEALLDVEISPAAIPADGKSTATVIIRIKDDKGNYITPLTERTVDLTATNGTITGSLKIPPRSQAGIATITSGQISGTAKVIASCSSKEEGKALYGEGKVVFTELTKMYCHRDGTPVVMDAKVCPTCNKNPLLDDTDTKQCRNPNCKTVIPRSASFCHKCGTPQQ